MCLRSLKLHRNIGSKSSGHIDPQVVFDDFAAALFHLLDSPGDATEALAVMLDELKENAMRVLNFQVPSLPVVVLGDAMAEREQLTLRATAGNTLLHTVLASEWRPRRLAMLRQWCHKNVGVADKRWLAQLLDKRNAANVNLEAMVLLYGASPESPTPKPSALERDMSKVLCGVGGSGGACSFCVVRHGSSPLPLCPVVWPWGEQAHIPDGLQRSVVYSP